MGVVPRRRLVRREREPRPAVGHQPGAADYAIAVGREVDLAERRGGPGELLVRLDELRAAEVRVLDLVDGRAKDDDAGLLERRKEDLVLRRVPRLEEQDVEGDGARAVLLENLDQLTVERARPGGGRIDPQLGV